MVRAEVLQGVRQMRFEGLLERHERGELLQEEAAEMLGISERTFRRWRDRLRDEGPEGFRDRRIGKPSSRQLGDWFWNETAAGAAIHAVREMHLASEDERLKLIAGNFIVPAARVRT